MAILIKDLLNWAKLQLISSDTAALDAEILLAHVLQINRAQLYARLEQIVTTENEITLKALIERRLTGEPIAYIIGYREFWSLPIKVTPDTLIPRPETECVVACVLDKLPAEISCKIADLGTGSGAIALALAIERRNWRITATDKMAAALTVAQNNAAHLQISNIAFYQGDWCNALPLDERFDAIVSNPPYINENDQYWQENTNLFEPASALIATAAGLADIAMIIQQAPAYLKPGGWLILEHGYDQASTIKELLINYGYKNLESLCDLARIPRVAVAQIP